MYLIGYDIGSSSVKASLVDSERGECIASAFYPHEEMKIQSLNVGWAEQDPDAWWNNLKLATKEILNKSKVDKNDIAAIGISYQMHGLVLVDKDKNVLRPAIIWCDSRAVPYGEKAFSSLGENFCLSRLLNSPGNFTAAKLAWVKENEPEVFDKIYKFMLPGDYIAMRLTGNISTTVSGLSEGVFWDFKNNCISKDLLDFFGFDMSVVPEIKPVFSNHGETSAAVAEELGLRAGIPVGYKGGDQPNNALSLNVLNPGEVASTAGTSGVVYGVNDKLNYDSKSRVNCFAHVNHKSESFSDNKDRIGVLLCINGTGILNAYMRRLVASDLSYSGMNELAGKSKIGSNGVVIMPFGNGAERMLENKNVGCSISGVYFNSVNRADILRAAQEGIVFSFAYGMEIMNEMGIKTKLIRAGMANMFLSPIFRNTLSGVTGATIELFDTDGSVGAARGAGIGVGIYKTPEEAFSSLKKLDTVIPSEKEKQAYLDAFSAWKEQLKKAINN